MPGEACGEGSQYVWGVTGGVLVILGGHPVSPSRHQILGYFDYAFTSIFTVEILLKVRRGAQWGGP